MRTRAQFLLRRAEVSDARRSGGRAVRRRAEVSDGTRRVSENPAGRYQTRGEADRVQGRTWEGGKGEEDRETRAGETIGRDGIRRTGGIGRAAGTRGGGIRRAEKRIGCRAVRGRGG